MTVTKETDFQYDIAPFHIVVRKFLDGVLEVGRSVDYRSVAFMFENSDRGNRQAKKYFSPYEIRVGQDELPAVYGFMKKADNEPGLEVADFVAQAAGTQTNVELGVEERIRKDFEAVFVGIGPGLGSNLHIRRVARSKKRN